MYYRHDWLTKFGQAVPTTWDEMIEFAKYATYSDPDGNGRDDTYGISVYGSTNQGYAYGLSKIGFGKLAAASFERLAAKWVSNLNSQR